MLAIIPVTTFRGRAPAFICNRQQDTLVPSITLHKRNAETRARICLVFKEATEFDPTCRFAFPVPNSEPELVDDVELPSRVVNSRARV